MYTREFYCDDCREHVISFGHVEANDNTVCATCQWIRTLPNENDRRRAREFLNRPEARQ